EKRCCQRWNSTVLVMTSSFRRGAAGYASSRIRGTPLTRPTVRCVGRNSVAYSAIDSERLVAFLHGGSGVDIDVLPHLPEFLRHRRHAGFGFRGRGPRDGALVRIVQRRRIIPYVLR